MSANSSAGRHSDLRDVDSPKAADRPPARPPEIEKTLARQTGRLPAQVDPAASPMFAATALIIVAAVVIAVLVGALFMSMQSG